MMFDKGDLVRWYPDYDNDIDYELAYFDSYAREDPTSCYIYTLDNLLIGIYTDVSRVSESKESDAQKFY
jgi:hypothetical protein